MSEKWTLAFVALAIGMLIGVLAGSAKGVWDTEAALARGEYQLQAGPSVCVEVTREGERVRWYCPEPTP